ncbi:DMT family transporter [Psychromonas algicola]|uniref:DMT family transporter n=1 Tax=Psychromonas algicola TaxID=2555642 RepID=UPI0010675B46|nr:DMT family transporter [Psychromonas sp. RZ5]TEW44854.1 EamA family transporter [Psychromonas sp. RZ5]
MFNNTFVLTTLALIAFAANSVFCRLALGDQQIDAGSFTVIRLFSGAVFLAAFLSIKNIYEKKKLSPTDINAQVAAKTQSKGSWLSAIWLFVYALTFSYAYIQLDTATGALVLFATVQVTMLLTRLLKGHKLSRAELLGLLLAVAGFVYLLAPQVSSPSLIAFVLMCLSGICWAFYTLAGKKSVDPSADTIFNFFRTLPFIFVFAVINLDTSALTQTGVLYAILSGVLASALGYLLWYKALTTLRHNVAAVVQLLVPVLAAVAGFIFLGESVSLVFLISSVMILSGILLVIKNPALNFSRTTK